MRDARGRGPAGRVARPPARRSAPRAARAPQARQVDLGARALLVARLLRISAPVLVILGGVRVWTLWNDHRHAFAIAFACVLVVVISVLAGFLPWFLRRAVVRRPEASPGR